MSEENFTISGLKNARTIIKKRQQFKSIFQIVYILFEFEHRTYI